MSTQILALQEEYARMQAFVESRDASTYALNAEFYQKRLRELDAEIDALIDAPKTKAEIQAATYKATCTACNIADAMKVCDVCVFRQRRSITEPQTAESAMLIGAPVDWPWTEEDYRAELDNQRPEVCL